MVIRRLKSVRGFSLPETLMVVMILGIIFMIGPQLLRQVTAYYYLHNAKIEIQRDARACLDTMNRFIRQAASSSVVIDQATGQPPYSRISFTTESGQTMQFYQKGNALYQVAQSTMVISNNLRYIAFT